MQIQGYLLSTTCLCVPDGDCALLEPLVLHCDCYLCEMQGLWFTMQLRVGCSKVMGEILSCWKQIASFRGTVTESALSSCVVVEVSLGKGSLWGVFTG